MQIQDTETYNVSGLQVRYVVATEDWNLKKYVLESPPVWKEILIELYVVNN